MPAAATTTGRVGSVVLCCRPTARGSAVSIAGGAKSPGVTCERNDMTTRLMCNRRHRRFDSIKSRSPIHAPSPLLLFLPLLATTRPPQYRRDTSPAKLSLLLASSCFKSVAKIPGIFNASLSTFCRANDQYENAVFYTIRNAVLTCARKPT